MTCCRSILPLRTQNPISKFEFGRNTDDRFYVFLTLVLRMLAGQEDFAKGQLICEYFGPQIQRVRPGSAAIHLSVLLAFGVIHFLARDFATSKAFIVQLREWATNPAPAYQKARKDISFKNDLLEILITYEDGDLVNGERVDLLNSKISHLLGNLREFLTKKRITKGLFAPAREMLTTLFNVIYLDNREELYQKFSLLLPTYKKLIGPQTGVYGDVFCIWLAQKVAQYRK